MSISTGPRRRGTDRDTTPGLCGNLNFCSLGMQRIQLRVPISQPFICPECSSPLRAPSRLARQESRLWLLPVNAWILVAGVTLSGLGGFVIGRTVPASHAPDPSSVPAPVDHAPNASLATRPPTPAGLTTDPGAAALPPPLVVAQRPYPSHAPAVEKIDPPHRMQAEVRSGQVVIDCLLGSALFHPACTVSHVRGTDAFSNAALAWLQKLPVRYVTGPHGAAPVALDHRWRVVFDDFTTPPPSPTAPSDPIVTPKRH